MELLFIYREALEDSLLGTIATALEAKKAGVDVGVLFTGEALAALAGRSFKWSSLIQDWDTRIQISRTAKKMGYRFADLKDDRWTKPVQLIAQAKEAGVHLLACPIWTKLLNVQGELPSELEEVDASFVIQQLRASCKIVGSF